MERTNTARSAETEMYGYVHAERPVEVWFLERLHRLDPLLEPRWNVLKHRWEIWRQGKYLLTVQTTQGEYAPLDNQVILKLWLADSHNYKNEFDFVASLRAADATLLNGKRHEQDEFMRAIFRDMSPFLRGRKSVVASRIMGAKK